MFEIVETPQGYKIRTPRGGWVKTPDGSDWIGSYEAALVVIKVGNAGSGGNQ